MSIFKPHNLTARPLGAATPSDAASYPMGVKSSSTLTLQTMLNPILQKNGYCPVVADGKIGPATCGALLQLYTDNPQNPDLSAFPTLQPTTCPASTTPPKKSSTGCPGVATAQATQASLVSGGAAPPSSSPLIATAPPSPVSSNTLLIGAGVLVGVGVLYFIVKSR